VALPEALTRQTANSPPVSKSAEEPNPRGDPQTSEAISARTNTHQSTTDPEARLAKKGRGFEAKLAYMGHALMENRHGLLVDFKLTHATGTAERDVVPQLLYDAQLRGFHPRTLGAAKAYDARACVATMREYGVTPHVAQNINGRRSAIDGRTTRHPGYATSQRLRKRVEEIFGWLKSVGGFCRTRYRGLARTQLAGYLVATAYNLVRMTRLLAKPVAS
jgi:IS5 family transposase